MSRIFVHCFMAIGLELVMCGCAASPKSASVASDTPSSGIPCAPSATPRESEVTMPVVRPPKSEAGSVDMQRAENILQRELEGSVSSDSSESCVKKEAISDEIEQKLRKCSQYLKKKAEALDKTVRRMESEKETGVNTGRKPKEKKMKDRALSPDKELEQQLIEAF